MATVARNSHALRSLVNQITKLVNPITMPTCPITNPTVIQISGRDRLKWLHSFVTNEIRQLTSQSWTEVFVTDSKGKTFSHGFVFLNDESLFYFSLQSGHADRLISHWDRYIISEDVTLQDVSHFQKWFFVTQDIASQIIEQLPKDSQSAEISLLPAAVSHQVIWLDQGPSLGELVIVGFAVSTPWVLFAGKLKNDLSSDESPVLLPQTLAAENGFPWFGIDFDESNLPQEIDRDADATSFKKGCYLGQETIARLDALGQVQKKLFPVYIESNLALQTPQNILFGSEIAGTLTSAYSSQTSKYQIGFAMLKRKYFKQADGLKLANDAAIHFRKDEKS